MPVERFQTAARLAAASALLAAAGCSGASRAYIVQAPLADLRSQPSLPQPGIHDPHQESQLLYAERVSVVKQQGAWSRIEALEQTEFTHTQRWQGYPGWVLTEALVPAESAVPPAAPDATETEVVIIEPWSQVWREAALTRPHSIRLPMGSRIPASPDLGKWRIRLVDGSKAWISASAAEPIARLSALPAREKRARILAQAKRLVGTPYYWGGRSAPAESADARVSGVDCSGLINLAYRASGLQVPRDAHEQFLKATPIANLQLADLIFLSDRARPNRMVHVMLYAGNGQVIEAPGTGLGVRQIALSERLGVAPDAIRSGAVVDGQTVRFGTFFAE